MSKARKWALVGTVFLAVVYGTLIFVYLVDSSDEKVIATVMSMCIATFSIPVLACTIYFWCGGDPNKPFSPGAGIANAIIAASVKRASAKRRP